MITSQPALIPSGLTPSALASWNGHIGITSGNPHGVTPSMIGALASPASQDGVPYLTTASSPTFAGLLVNGAALFSGGYVGSNVAPLFCQNTTSYGSGGIYTQNSQIWLNSTGASSIARMRNDGTLFCNAVSASMINNSGGATPIYFHGTNVGIGSTVSNALGALHIINTSTTQPTEIVQNIASQTGNATEWWSATGTVQSYVDCNGYASFGGANKLNNTGVFTPSVNDNNSLANARIVFGGSSKYVKCNANSVDRLQVDSNGAWMMGAQGANALGFGDPTANGSWRIVGDGTNLLMQKLVSGTWTTKSTIAG